MIIELLDLYYLLSILFFSPVTILLIFVIIIKEILITLKASLAKYFKAKLFEAMLVSLHLSSRNSFRHFIVFIKLLTNQYFMALIIIFHYFKVKVKSNLHLNYFLKSS